MPQLDITLLFQFGTFIFLMIILNFLLYRPLRRVLQKRHSEITESHARVRVLGKGAEVKIGIYEAKLEEARKAGAEVKTRLRQEGLQEEQKMLCDAEEEALRKKNLVRQQIIAETAAAKKDLQTQTDLLAREITEKLLGRAV